MHTVERLVSFIAPHHCIECGREGQLLCGICCLGLSDEIPACCLFCGQPSTNGRVCAVCQPSTPIVQAWYLGVHEGVLAQLIHRMKFAYARSASEVLAQAMDAALPYLPPRSVVVPVPTAPRRVRQRGFDHAVLVAKHLAKMRDVGYAPLLGRAHNHRQVGASKAGRWRQAATAYEYKGSNLPPATPLLLVDDVFTTGASLTAASAALQKAGYQHIMASVAARHVL